MPSKACPIIDDVKLSHSKFAQHCSKWVSGFDAEYDLYYSIRVHPCYRLVSITWLYSYYYEQLGNRYDALYHILQILDKIRTTIPKD